MRMWPHLPLLEDKPMIEIVDELSSITFVGSPSFMPSFLNNFRTLVVSFTALCSANVSALQDESVVTFSGNDFASAPLIMKMMPVY